MKRTQEAAEGDDEKQTTVESMDKDKEICELRAQLTRRGPLARRKR